MTERGASPCFDQRAMTTDPHYPLLLDLLAPPWRRFEIISHSTPAEVISAIQSATEERRRFRVPFSNSRDFEGVVYDDRFEISRIIRYRNSLRPLISGRVEPSPLGTRLAIVMRPPWFAAAASAAVIAVVVTIIILTQIALHGSQSGSQSLAIIAAVIAGSYLMITIPFGLEVHWARELLQRLLDMAEVLSPSAAPSTGCPRADPLSFTGRGPYATAEQLRRHSRIRRAFLIYLVAVSVTGIVTVSAFRTIYRSAATHPTGAQTEPVKNHRRIVYVTPRQKQVVKLLKMLSFGGLILVALGALIIDRFLGVPLFPKPSGRPGWSR